ncbi:hypothetical protein ACP70R_006088 [Stipagrostis hirtigluma subsp. patula]
MNLLSGWLSLLPSITLHLSMSGFRRLFFLWSRRYMNNIMWTTEKKLGKIVSWRNLQVSVC